MINLFLSLFLFVCLLFTVVAQTPSHKKEPSEEELQKVARVINRAEAYFQAGQKKLRDKNAVAARKNFDEAIDTILSSGLDIRKFENLHKYYDELIERIHKLETSISVSPRVVANEAQTPMPSVGFREQKFEPSPLDELSKLVLTDDEQTVNPEDVTSLEQAKTSIDFGFNTNPLIQQFINYYQGRGRATMQAGIRRSGQFMKMARKIFREEGVPEDVTWLGQVESDWNPRYLSPRGDGLWQFPVNRGREYGLRLTMWIDERMSLEKATRAAAKYLKFLANHYNGDWELAMAAYNTGQGNVDRAISRAGGRRNFWAIYPYIAQETRNYVPNILATILIAKNPEKYGFRNVRPDAPMAYDVVQVPTATSLHLIAQATGVSVDYIRSLNPELKRDVTPRGERYDVRIPGGKANEFVAQLRKIPSERRDGSPDDVRGNDVTSLAQTLKPPSQDENGWATLTAGQTVYGIRYDTNGAVIVNNDLVMGCVPIPQSYDIALNVSRPSPIKKLVLIICSRGEGGDDAYIIDTVRNRVASRDVVPKHWQIIYWISWSPDERFALVAAAGEITNGDMAFVDLQTGRVEEIHFKNFTRNPRRQDEIQDFDPNSISWINSESFSLRLDVRCNPYDGDESCRRKILRSHPVLVNLNPFSISYGNVGQVRSPGNKPGVSSRGSQTGKDIRSVAAGESTNIRQVDFKNHFYPLSARCTSLLSRAGNIRLKNGESDVIKKAPYECVFSLEGEVSYGDLTRDGTEEALVYAGCRCANMETLSNFEEGDSDLFVYALRNGEVSLLTTFDYDDFSGQGYNRIYQSYFKDGTEIVSLSGSPKIEDGFLVLKMLAYKGNFRVDPPNYKIEMKYRWNVSEFVLAERPKRWLCRDQLCQ